MEALIYTPSVRKNDIMQALCDFYSFQFNLQNSRKWILFSANKLSKIFKNIKHSFFLCKGEIAALVYTKQNNKIKTQASELYTVINQYRNTVTEAKLSTQD